MSYDIYIGNAEPYEEEEDYRDQFTVNRVTLPEAPTFPGDGMTGNSNSRHPGYIGWGNFCNKTRLGNLFFDAKTGLMREHPGIVELQEEHAQAIEKVLAKWRENHSDAVPGFGSDLYDPILARLIWLDFWVKWALKNCERPAIHNH
jgi:hypothetical protein